MTDEKKGIYVKKDGRYVAFQPLLSWSLNQKSWLENNMFPVMIIKYEELISETFITFKKVLNFIYKITNSKILTDRKKIINSIKNCEFQNLKKLEKEKGFEEADDKNTKEKIKFFNLGQKNEWSKILDNKIAKEIEIKFGDEMKKLNYL